MNADAAGRMDQMYRYQRHVYDLTRRYYLLGRTTLINGLLPPDGGTVLEIGCGTAWNLIRAAETYPNAKYYGFDVSAVMLDTARQNIAKSPHQIRITVAQGDATTFSGEDTFGISRFDCVFASYSLSMIPQWRLVLERALANTAPGGALHIVDFGAGAQLPALVRTGLHAWLEQFDVTPRTTLQTELAALAAREKVDVFYTGLYRDYAQYAVLTRR